MGLQDLVGTLQAIGCCSLQGWKCSQCASYVALDPSDAHVELLFSGCVLAEMAMWQCVSACHSMRC